MWIPNNNYTRTADVATVGTNIFISLGRRFPVSTLLLWQRQHFIVVDALGNDHLTWRGVGYVFLFRSEFFFRTTQELEYLFFLSRKVQIFFPEFNITLVTKYKIEMSMIKYYHEYILFKCYYSFKMVLGIFYCCLSEEVDVELLIHFFLVFWLVYWPSTGKK
jgi:hypothetical protein